MTKSEARAFIDAFVKLRGIATDAQALEVPSLYPAWKEDKTYKTDDRIIYNNILYKVLQDHTSQASWAPDAASSLFTKVLIPDSTIIYEWVQPDSTNAYKIGDKVTHNDKTWVSIVDNNVWEPGVYGWEVV